MSLRRFRFLGALVLGLAILAGCGPDASLARAYSRGEAAEETDAIKFFSEVCFKDPAYKDACQQLAAILDGSLVLVPAGEFLMGNDDMRSSEAPQRSVYLDTYKIQVYEVTYVQYQQFVRDTGRAAPPAWTADAYPSGEPLVPVTGVLWEEADAYCAWAGLRLPTEAEWEKAARGVDGLIYPWGNAWDSRRANTAEAGFGKPLPVGSYPESASPYGALDMAGNVWEWVADRYDPDYYRVAPERNPTGPDAVLDRGLRGGGFDSDAEQARSAFRNSSHSDRPNPRVGFRCAQ